MGETGSRITEERGVGPGGQEVRVAVAVTITTLEMLEMLEELRM